MKKAPFDGLTFVALFLVGIMGFSLFSDLTVTKAAEPGLEVSLTIVVEDQEAVSLQPKEESDETPLVPMLSQGEEPDPTAFAAPYDKYMITQGVHGQSYGHLAIDLGNGKGATIIAPIHGTVTEHYLDGLGNTTLVIENEVYAVTMLHGIYTVAPGDAVSLGDPVGTESNQGNTTDFQGRSCRDRDCGYHTHLNVFDKRTGGNVNPLDLIGK